MKYDVFISYRRDGGEYTAKIICDKLSDMGYQVFFDLESLRSGKFNKKLLSVIEECTDFICILSPNSLDRCKNEDDWVRQELECAFETKKNIIPILLRGFQFPNDLPESIEQIRYQSGLEASTEFLDAFIARLVKFLNKKPTMVHRIKQNIVLKKMLPSLIALLIVAILIIGGVVSYNRLQNSFPRTQIEKNIVKEIVYYDVTNLQQANIGMDNYRRALKEINTYLITDSSDIDKKKILLDTLEYYQNYIIAARGNLINVPSSLSNKIDNTPLSKENIFSFKSSLDSTLVDYIHKLSFFYYVIEGNLYTEGSLLQIEKLCEASYEQDENLLFYSLNETFIPVNDTALKDLKEKYLPSLTALYDGQIWESDINQIKGIETASIQEKKNIENDYISTVGEKKLNLEEISKLKIQADTDLNAK